MVENGRKTAKARSKNVCNAGCCALFPATTTHFPPASTVSPGRQNKLDSTVGNQLAPAPNTGEHVAQSLPSALRFSFLFAAPPPGQRKYLAVNVLSVRVYSYEYLSRYESMLAFIGQHSVPYREPFRHLGNG